MSPKDLKREIFLKQGSLPDDYIINAVKELGAERWKYNGKAATRKYIYHRLLETAEGVELQEFRVATPGRPFVFRRADFIDDNTWSASAAFELQNKPGREAITRTTMAKTKAQMAEQIKEMEDQRLRAFQKIQELQEKSVDAQQQNARLQDQYSKLLDGKLELEREHQAILRKMDALAVEADMYKRSSERYLKQLQESGRDVHRLVSVLSNMAKEARDNELPF